VILLWLSSRQEQIKLFHSYSFLRPIARLALARYNLK